MKQLEKLPKEAGAAAERDPCPTSICSHHCSPLRIQIPEIVSQEMHKSIHSLQTVKRHIHSPLQEDESRELNAVQVWRVSGCGGKGRARRYFLQRVCPSEENNRILSHDIAVFCLLLFLLLCSASARDITDVGERDLPMFNFFQTYS